jgi:hypothetical protein
MQNLRNNKNFRLGVIIFLMLVVVVLYFRNVDTASLSSGDAVAGELKDNYKPDTLEKKVLLGIFAVLGGALGMEATNNDFDMKKLIDSKGNLSASRVLRDKSGNVVTAEEVASGAKSAKYTDEYNCDDFKVQAEAQAFFVKAVGVAGDTNRLDGNKDGTACQALPVK